jgi:tetratricopeptide (TPR) repeat protein
MSESAVLISGSARDRIDHDVFISYSRRDSEFARCLLEALKGENRDTWVDWQSIQAAEDFWQAIVTGIEAANSFIFVISPDSIASQYCNQEVDHAVLHKKRLIPVVCRSVSPETVHSALRSLDWIFFRDGEFDSAFARLVKAIDTDPLHTRSHTRLLVKAIEWDKRGRDDSFLLRKSDLTEAETWLAASAEKEPIPTDLQRDYITTSRRVENDYNQLLAKGEQALQRVKTAKIVVFVAFAIASLAGIYTFFQYQNAKDADQRATIADQKAKNADQKAEDADQKAEDAAKRAMVADRNAKDAEARLRGVSTNLQQKEKNIQDVWSFSDAEGERAKGNYDNALNILQAVIDNNPRNTFAIMGRGFAYQNKRNYQEAEEDFRLAISIDRNIDPYAWLGLGNALYSQNRLNEAISAYNQAIRLNSKYDTAYYNLGNALYEQNRLDEAISAYNQAIQINPSYSLADAGRRKAYAKKRR